MVQVSGHGGSDPGGGQNYPGQSNGSGTHRTDKCAARTRAFGLKQAEKQWDNGHSRKVRSATTASGHFEFEMPASFRVYHHPTQQPLQYLSSLEFLSVSTHRYKTSKGHPKGISGARQLTCLFQVMCDPTQEDAVITTLTPSPPPRPPPPPPPTPHPPHPHHARPGPRRFWRRGCSSSAFIAGICALWGPHWRSLRGCGCLIGLNGITNAALPVRPVRMNAPCRPFTQPERSTPTNASTA